MLRVQNCSLSVKRTAGSGRAEEGERALLSWFIPILNFSFSRWVDLARTFEVLRHRGMFPCLAYGAKETITNPLCQRRLSYVSYFAACTRKLEPYGHQASVLCRPFQSWPVTLFTCCKLHHQKVHFTLSRSIGTCVVVDLILVWLVSRSSYVGSKGEKKKRKRNGYHRRAKTTGIEVVAASPSEMSPKLFCLLRPTSTTYRMGLVFIFGSPQIFQKCDGLFARVPQDNACNI